MSTMFRLMLCATILLASSLRAEELEESAPPDQAPAEQVQDEAQEPPPTSAQNEIEATSEEPSPEPVRVDAGESKKVITRSATKVKVTSPPEGPPTWRCRTIPDQAFVKLGTFGTKQSRGRSHTNRARG